MSRTLWGDAAGVPSRVAQCLRDADSAVRVADYERYVRLETAHMIRHRLKRVDQPEDDVATQDGGGYARANGSRSAALPGHVKRLQRKKRVQTSYERMDACCEVGIGKSKVLHSFALFLRRLDAPDRFRFSKTDVSYIPPIMRSVDAMRERLFALHREKYADERGGSSMPAECSMEVGGAVSSVCKELRRLPKDLAESIAKRAL